MLDTQVPEMAAIEDWTMTMTKSSDIDECQDPALCQNGDCTNTRGSYSCLCKAGYLLDSSRSSCISQHVISEAKGPCYRILREGGCSLPILRNITKQICCCSRVGKAWGKGCERCPVHGSDDFKEICPAGPGYHYSAADLKFNTRFLGQDPPRIPLHRHTVPRPVTPSPPPQDVSVHEVRRPARPVLIPDERRPVRLPSQEERVAAAPDVTEERRPAVPVERPAVSEETRPVRPAVPEERRPLVPAVRPTAALSAAVTPAAERNVCELNPRICGPGRCVPRQGSYTCVCNNGFWLSTQGTHCIDVDECRQSPRPCLNGRCENTVGSYRCTCAPGFRSNVQGTECSDIDECSVTQHLCSNGRCENTPGSYRCLCSGGFVLNPQGNSCIDVDECRQPSRRACTNGQCENTVGSFLCVCPAGFQSNAQGTECHDIDECRQTPRPCGSGRCENTAGSFRCVCPAGFRLNLQDAECVDINECENPASCAGQECVNTAGSFQCRPCRPGYSVQNRRCTDINECLEGEYCFPKGECLNTDGSYTCLCAEGFTTSPDRASCIDKDECRLGGVCEGGRCSNTEGSFQCVCQTGFKLSLDKAACIDVDECMEHAISQCGTQRCENTPGSYKCVSRCETGYRATESGSCTDINECTNRTVCGEHGVCLNVPGSYRCLCIWGYQVASDGQHCVDIDECVEYGSSLCGLSACENTAGAYKCVTSCDSGYQLTPSGECTDINECQNRSTCGEHAMCQNLVGSFQCLCDQGYEGTRDGRQCIDVNECRTLQGVCGMALCENVEGSFLCICPNSNEEFDPMTGKCVRHSSAVRPLPPSRVNPPRTGSGAISVSGLKECYYNLDDVKVCENILALNLSWEHCCCSVGEGWGSGCQIQKCPLPDTDEFRSLCPGGAGYIAASQGYKDADECTLFGTQVCKGGVCVNKIPGYSCYCTNGYYYDVHRLECIDKDYGGALTAIYLMAQQGKIRVLNQNDNNECLEEETCVGGHCVNTVGSYYCTCEVPLILDGSQRRCVTNTSQSQGDSLAYCWQEVGPDLVCSRPMLHRQTTYTECCCLYGEAWGMSCALCPSRDSDDYEALCNFLRPPAYGPAGPLPSDPYDYTSEYGPSYNLPYGPDPYAIPPPQRHPAGIRPGYESYPLAGGGDGGSLTSYGSRSPSAYGRRDSLYSRPSYESPDFDSDLSYTELNEEDPRVPYRRQASVYDSQSRPAGTRYRPRSPPSIPGFGSEDSSSSQPWRYEARDGGSFSEFPTRPRSLSETYEDRYEQFEGLQAEECGILNGCENGRCIRVPEGYTCDCYDGYRLDMTRMACVDINECDEAEDLSVLCINGQCRNTDGSYECICHRGYVMSRQRNFCVLSRS